MARTKLQVSNETKKASKKKSSSKAKVEKAAQVPAVLRLIKNDNGLAEYADAINGRHDEAVRKMAEITGGTNNLSEFASGYLYFGCTRLRTDTSCASGLPMLRKSMS